MTQHTEDCAVSLPGCSRDWMDPDPETGFLGDAFYCTCEGTAQPYGAVTPQMGGSEAPEVLRESFTPVPAEGSALRR